MFGTLCNNRLLSSLETAENELGFSTLLAEGCQCCCHLRRGIGSSWMLLEGGLEKTQGSQWMSPGSTELCATGQDMGRCTYVHLCPQLLPVTAWTLSGCWLLWKLFWDTRLALWSHWVLAANSMWGLSLQESRHIKSSNLLWQTAELCSLSLPLHLIKAEIVLGWYISM